MKSISDKKSSKKILFISSIVFCIILAAILFLHFAGVIANNTSHVQGGGNEPSQEKSSSASDTTTSSSPDSTNKGSTNTDPQAETYKDQESGKTIVSVVTSSSIVDGILLIRGGINNAVGADGSCYAVLTGPDGTTTRKSTAPLPNPSTVDCKTIQIPTSSLAHGKWTYTLNYESKEYKGTSDEETFSID